MKDWKQPLSLLVRRSFWPLVLVAIALTVAFANFDAKTWLTGWDTLHPEFDFALNFRRVLFGVWREDQGLGAVAAHSHMSELPRIIVLWLFSLVMPLHNIKFIYVLLCLVLGPLGVYYFLERVVLQPKKSVDQPTLATPNYFAVHKLGAFIGGLWYLFNLGTVQHFYVVFEMFAVQYAAIGWLFLLVHRVLSTRDRKYTVWFFVASFLAAPMAYASTLWFAYALGVALYALSFVLAHRTKIALGRAVLVGVLLITSNAFWLLPNLYFLTSGASKAPQNSHINELFSPEAFLHNQAYGNLPDIALLKNFLFSWTQYSPDQNATTFLLKPWINHLEQPLVVPLMYGFALIALIGLIMALYKRKRTILYLLPMGVICLIMLINANPPFEGLFNFLRSKSGLFEEGLRFPFTKFSIVYMLVVAALIGRGWQTIVEQLTKIAKSRGKTLVTVAGTAIAVFCLIYTALPMFQGQLINPRMRNTIPTEYFSFFNWVKTQPTDTRFIQFPLQTSAGWDHYDWNYEGPGFLWFGMKQPLLVRDFDRWSPYNETAYNELSAALYAENIPLFKSILQKYQLGFAVIDEHIIAPGLDKSVLKYIETRAMLTEIGAKEVFTENGLSVYDLRSVTGADHLIQSPQTFASLELDTIAAKFDPGYAAYGTYVTNIADNKRLLPFAHLTKDARIPDASVSLSGISLKSSIKLPMSDSNDAQPYVLTIPGYKDGEAYTTQLSATYADGVVVINFSDPLALAANGQNLSLSQPPVVSFQADWPTSKLVVQIGETQLQIAEGETKRIDTIQLTVGKPFAIDLINGEAVTEVNGELVVPPDAVASHGVSASFWQEITSDRVVALDSSAVEQGSLSITAVVPSIPITLNLQDSTTAFNCDTFGRGTIKKNVEAGAQYSASNFGSICEHFVIPNLSSFGSYFLRIKGSNNAGRSSKFYTKNTVTNKTELEHLLPTGSYDVFYSLLQNSRDTTTATTYALTFETRSFSQRESNNTIQEVALYPLPLRLLSGIHVSRVDTAPSQQNGIVAQKITTLFPGAYITKIASNAAAVTADDDLGTGALALLYSFNTDWIAFDTKYIGTLLPHGTLNGWANTWFLDNSQSSAEKTIVILFVPQLFELLGLGIGVGTIIWLVGFMQQKSKARRVANKSFNSLIGHTMRGKN